MGKERVILEDIQEAQSRIQKHVSESPMVPLHVECEGKQIFLKLENLHPVGSFKLRGACNTLLSLPPEELRDGIATISTGNFGHAAAWMAHQMGISCHVVVPDHVPDAKMAGVLRHGGHVVRVPWDTWWGYVQHEGKPDLPGYFVHPEDHDAILAGNGTLGLETLEQMPDVDTVLIPYGSGGLTAGAGTAIKSLNPKVKVIACEVATAAPLTAAMRVGRPVPVDYTSSFVDGIGCPGVLPEMWGVVKKVVDETVVVDLDDVTAAVRLLAERNHVIAEGAGAVPVAAAVKGNLPGRKIVCVVTGGNIDMGIFRDLVRNE